MSRDAPDNAEQFLELLVRTKRVARGVPVSELSGGVSSIVLRVDDPAGPWIAKAPRSRLAVADEWVVDRARGRNEADILKTLGGHVGPVRVPSLIFFDSESVIAGMEYIESTGATYKDLLMDGRADPRTAGQLGLAASALHDQDAVGQLAGNGPRELFEALRLDPYYMATAARQPELAADFEALIEDTRAATPRRFVHGDFTPKNVLVGTHGPAVIDWEVIHVGDPSFDLATMTAHFILKASRPLPPGGPEPFLAAIDAFWSAYSGPADLRRALRHTGAVLLARLHGKSRVEYLNDPNSRSLVHCIGREALSGALDHIEELITIVRGYLVTGSTP